MRSPFLSLLAALILAIASADGQAAAARAKPHPGTGTVLSADPASGYVELDHDPIPSLDWPRMSMGFQVRDKRQLRRLKAGDRVRFELEPKPDPQGEYAIRNIAPVRARRPKGG